MRVDIGQNLERRDLNADQRAHILAELMPKLKAEAKERQREHGKTAPGKKANTGAKSGTSVKARDIAAAQAGVSHTKIDMSVARRFRLTCLPGRRRLSAWNRRDPMSWPS